MRFVEFKQGEFFKKMEIKKKCLRTHFFQKPI